jgi:N-acylneuraminate cytidylyltransferase
MSAVSLIDATASSQQDTEFLKSRVCGEALFLHAAHAAAASESISCTVVVTTDPEIEQIAKNSGFEALLLGTDEPRTPIVDRLAEFPAALTEEIVVVVSAHAPLVTPEDIDSFVKKASDGAKEGVFSAFELNPKVDTGTLYAFSRSAIEKAGSLPKLQLTSEVLPAFHAVHIRRPEELHSVAALLKRQPLHHLLRKYPMQALVLDFDGVFTDNKVIVSADGLESAICDRSDGFAIQSLQRRGFPILVLSTEKIPIVRVRSQKLGLECIHGVDDKVAILETWLKDKRIDPEHTIYVGNDINDLGCMEMVGMPIAVADAFPEVLGAARCILTARGGHGAVREIATAVAAALDGRG